MRRFTSVVLFAALVVGGVNARTQSSTQLLRILTVLGGPEALVVAEIGAGDGQLTVEIAKALGENGHLFSTEVSPVSLQNIRDRVALAGLRNVTVVTGEETTTNLPRSCCDAVVMNDVYHHLSAPAAINRSILDALRPGGRLVVLDFGPPPGTESRDPARRGDDGRHGITPQTLESELRAAGFEVRSTESYGFRAFMTVARKPMGK